VYGALQPKIYKTEITIREAPSSLFEAYRPFFSTQQKQQQQQQTLKSQPLLYQIYFNTQISISIMHTTFHLKIGIIRFKLQALFFKYHLDQFTLIFFSFKMHKLNLLFV
jgi:hypothetical protein